MPGLRIHIRDDDMIIILAEEQLGAVRGIGDTGEGAGFVEREGGAVHGCRDESLEDLASGGIEYDYRLWRAHEQHRAAFSLAIRIERYGFGAHRRSKLHNFSGGRQGLIVRCNNRAIILRTHSAIGSIGRTDGLRNSSQCRDKKASKECREFKHMWDRN